MAVDSISNYGTAYVDIKTEQKVQNAGVHTAGNAANSPNGKVQGGTDNKDAQVNEQSVKNVVDQTNNKIKDSRQRLEFSYHKEINRVSIKVMDVETNEVIREIPPEKSLEMIQKLWEAAGLLVDEKR